MKSGVTIGYSSGNWVEYADNGITTIIPPVFMRVDLTTPLTDSLSAIAIASIGGDTLLRNPYATIQIPAVISITDKNGGVSPVGGKMGITANGDIYLEPLYFPAAIRPTTGVNQIIIQPSQISFPSSVG